MGVVAGDITEITYNHPTIGSGSFFPKSAEDSTYDLGGFESDDDKNNIDGSGARLDKMNRVAPFFQAVCTNDMNVREDYEKAVALRNDPVPADWTITHVNGTVHGLKRGKPVGTIEANMNAGTFTLKVAGDGQMSKIVG